jgi:hypothetical protein
MTVYFQGSKTEARNLIIGVVRSLSGNSTEQAQAAKSVHTAIGVAALTDIKADFIRKSRGEVGEDGVKWEPLSREYLAYGGRRFGPGEQATLKRQAGLNQGNRHRGLLSSAQNKRWKMIFATRFKRFVLSMPPGEAKARAAQIAWATLKREGAKTKLEVFGTRQVDILRDTGILLNSLSPGVVDTGGNYQAPEDQVFDLTGSGVIVGTTVPYAKYHQGPRKNKKNERPFLPKDEAPAIWKTRWVGVGLAATVAAIRRVLGGGQ